ncbi:MAG: hypothetical protein DWQ05_18895 [Calditrichaeota bacterium]|nr:MAG: hypothetical protein DWQ05_18895 [Calditrichota bacterium]
MFNASKVDIEQFMKKPDGLSGSKMTEKMMSSKKYNNTIVAALIVLNILLLSCDTETSLEPAKDDSTRLKAEFSSIQTSIFQNRCATSGCHSSQTKSANLDLSAANAYSNLVGVQALLSTQGFKRVEPGNSESSFLIKVLNGSDPTQMPLNRAPLDAASIAIIAQWIDAGAKNN